MLNQITYDFPPIGADDHIRQNFQDDVPVSEQQRRLHQQHENAEDRWGTAKISTEGSVCPVKKLFERQSFRNVRVQESRQDCVLETGRNMAPIAFGHCGHAFHIQCIMRWIAQPQSKNTCPICRRYFEFQSGDH
jgi:hypothetical protein